MSIEQWKQVLFTDECHFLVQGQQSQFIRRSIGESVNSAHFNQTLKHPQKVMIWACFSYDGPGRLQVCEKMMNSDCYIEIIDHRILPQLRETFANGGSTLQHDLAPCHTSKKVKEHLLKRDIQVLPWPGNSPDIAPIENLFAIVKNKLRQKDTTTKQKLIRAILDIWNGDPSIAETCKSLVNSMPSRVDQVIKARGGHINY